MLDHDSNKNTLAGNQHAIASTRCRRRKREAFIDETGNGKYFVVALLVNN